MSGVVCRNCSNVGHFVRDCPSLVCHGCGGNGHFRNDCPATSFRPSKRSRSSSPSDSRRDLGRPMGGGGGGMDQSECFACGASGHHRSQCPSHCSNCGQNGHVISRCPRRDLSDTCFHCAEEGHLSNQCPYRSQGGDRLCYQCHQPGHLASRCPRVVRCHQCGELGHMQARCPRMVPICADCHERHLQSNCPATSTTSNTLRTSSPQPVNIRSSPTSLATSEDLEGANDNSAMSPTSSGVQEAAVSVVSTVTTAPAAAVSSAPPPALAAVPPFEASSSDDRKGRVAVILDGAYFERCIAGYHRKEVAQYLKCKELLKYTLDHIGSIFNMHPIAYWFDTDPSSFASFIESTTNNPIQREAILRDNEVRKRWLLDFMNGGKELNNVVAKLVGGMKRQRGFTQDGMGHVWVQTGVDVSIATCVIECFQDRRQYQQVVLVSGDSDLYPCVHYCNQTRRGLPADVPPVRVCGTSGSISRVFGQHQDLSDFLPRILLDEPQHNENGVKTPFTVASFFAETWKN